MSRFTKWGGAPTLLARPWGFPMLWAASQKLFFCTLFWGISKKAFKPMDREEKDLMESIEKEEWLPVKKLDREKDSAVHTARNTLKKDKRINLRLSQKDYHQIQLRAIEEGIPYQTLIASIVHKYLNGSLSPIYREEKIQKEVERARKQTG